MSIELSLSVFLLILSLLFFLISKLNYKSDQSFSTHLPKSYPLVGNYFALVANFHRRVQWMSEIVQNSPSATFVFHRPLYRKSIITGNPANVQHILKTHFHIYEKGSELRTMLSDFLGNGILNVDGHEWKFQRQVASHEFNTKSLRKFIENVVDAELSERLIPILSSAAANETVLDLQDILKRFAFDNICKISFGYDSACLLPHLPEPKFAQAFEAAERLSNERFASLSSVVWKIKRFLGTKSERRLKEAVSEVREFAKAIIKERRDKLKQSSSLESDDLLSRLLVSSQLQDEAAIDVIISFLVAGRDTTSAALSWFFWFLHKNPEVENNILKEIYEKSEKPILEEVKDMVYTHASLCESLRLYPPVPWDVKVANSDDVLPDGTVVKKGSRVVYHPYAMGRLEMVWGKDWAEYKPERWLQREGEDEKWSFVSRDPYSFPVFQAGPRICLGKEMAFLQMKRVVAGVLSRFKVVPVAKGEPVFIVDLGSKMKDGFPVRIEERVQK